MFFTVSRKNVIEDFFFLKKKEKGASSEQILKNLLGRDHSGILFTFFSFEGKHLVPVKAPNLSCVF